MCFCLLVRPYTNGSQVVLYKSPPWPLYFMGKKYINKLNQSNFRPYKVYATEQFYFLPQK